MTTSELIHQIWTEATTFDCYECPTHTDDASEHLTINMMGLDDDIHFCSKRCADFYAGRNGRWAYPPRGRKAPNTQGDQEHDSNTRNKPEQLL